MSGRPGARRLVVVGAAGSAVAVLLAEAAHLTFHLLERRRHEGGAGRPVLLVLGYPSRRSGRMHPVQRWRCRIADRSLEGVEQRSVVVFTGRGRPGQPSEAEVMATEFARLGPADRAEIVVEVRAESTQQNIERSLPALRSAGTVTLVSDPIHATRAARYLRAVAPDVAGRLRPADDYRPFEHPVLKVGTAVYELLNAARKRTVARR